MDGEMKVIVSGVGVSNRIAYRAAGIVPDLGGTDKTMDVANEVIREIKDLI